MTRKDSDKDAERPHYYSQFWLDVAAGRRIIGMPKPNEDGETAEPETPEPVRKTTRVSDASASSDGRVEAPIRPVAEPVAAPKEFIEPDEPEDEADEEEEPELQQAAVDDKDIPDMDLGPTEEEEESEDEEREEEEFFDEEEEEEDIGWGNRGRKKPKPARVVKQPPKKPVKRDRRSGY